MEIKMYAAKRIGIVFGILICIVLLTGLGVFFFSNHDSQEPVAEPFIPYKASFALFTNDVSIQFVSDAYVLKSNDIFLSKEEPQIIHVQKPNVTWREFFDTLPLVVSETCIVTITKESYCSNDQTALRFFLNGTEQPQLLRMIIQPKDQALVTYGVTTEQQVKRQLQQIPVVQ